MRVSTETSQDENAVGELTLRRFRAGELSAEQQAAVQTRLAIDGQLRARLTGLDDEQSTFEAELSFERFSGGVARAQRDLARKRSAWKAPLAGAGGMALAAAAVLLLFARPATAPLSTATQPAARGDRIKGAGPIAAYVRIANAQGVQRVAEPEKVTDLATGDRLRVGVQIEAGAWYFAAFSVEQNGNAAALYPESGGAMKLVATDEPTYFPDSVELTGQGHETLFVLVAGSPFDVNQGIVAVQTAASSAGGLYKITEKDFPWMQKVTLIRFPFNKL